MPASNFRERQVGRLFKPRSDHEGTAGDDLQTGRSDVAAQHGAGSDAAGAGQGPSSKSSGSGTFAIALATSGFALPSFDRA